MLAVGEFFVRARSARSQARSACVIARRRRVSIRPKAEHFARRRRSACHIACRRRVLIRSKAERSILAVVELFVWAQMVRSKKKSIIEDKKIQLKKKSIIEEKMHYIEKNILAKKNF